MRYLEEEIFNTIVSWYEAGEASDEQFEKALRYLMWLEIPEREAGDILRSIENDIIPTYEEALRYERQPGLDRDAIREKIKEIVYNKRIREGRGSGAYQSYKQQAKQLDKSFKHKRGAPPTFEKKTCPKCGKPIQLCICDKEKVQERIRKSFVINRVMKRFQEGKESKIEKEAYDVGRNAFKDSLPRKCPDEYKEIPEAQVAFYYGWDGKELRQVPMSEIQAKDEPTLSWSEAVAEARGY
jgi:hypothetical protein